MKWKSGISALIAASMLLTAVPARAGQAAAAEPRAAAESIAEAEETAKAPERLPAADGAEAVVHRDADGKIFFIEGSCTADKVTNMKEAEKVVDSMLPALGSDGRSKFEPWRDLTDPAGSHYYVFQQMYADTTVSGGAVKIITDSEGTMTGLVSSMVAQLPDTEESEGITPRRAEEIVVDQAVAAGRPEPEIIGDLTSKIILPVNLVLDMESTEEVEESRFVWVVYTNNPDASVSSGSELPYLAHYVTTGGEYLYSLPTIVPGDEAGESGFGSSYIFEFMEPAEYSGTVTLSDGREKEISVDVMKDSRTGMFYLGNLERRIVVADCYEFLYNGGTVKLEASSDNADWDPTCLLSLYNYCKAWDYYSAIGWRGGDGLGTPMIILKEFCDENHTPINNAAYAGRYYGWQVFLSSSANDFAQCVDILAHEFTHCVTHSVMTYNAYRNDYGAINEAMSDIQGKLCDIMDRGPESGSTWELGEDSLTNIRSMSDPHRFQQPEYVWDLYYTPRVQTPTELNDRGGVHANSSLLNRIAYLLCTEGGMTPEEGRIFWFATDCTMVPGTDYAQLSELLPWVLGNLGMDQYADTLAGAIEATGIKSDDMPESFPEDRALLTLTLPDDETFTDGNWALMILSVNADLLAERIHNGLGGDSEYEDLPSEFLDIIKEHRDEIGDMLLEKMGLKDLPGDTLSEAEIPDSSSSAPSSGESLDEALYDLAQKYLEDVFYLANIAAGQDGRTIRLVCRPGLTIPILYRMEFKPNSTTLKSLGGAVYTFGAWYDLGSISLKNAENGNPSEISPDEVAALTSEILEKYFGVSPGESAAGANETDGTGSPEDLPGSLLDILSKAADKVTETVDFVKHIPDYLETLKLFVFYEIEGGRICTIPSTGLENLTIIDEGQVALFNSLLAGQAQGDDEAAETGDVSPDAA